MAQAVEMQDKGDPLLSPRGSPSPKQQGGSGSQTAVVIDLSGAEFSRSRSSVGASGSPRGGSASPFGGGAGSSVFDAARERAGSVYSWFVESSSVLRTYMSREAKIMSALVLLGAIVFLSVSLAVAIKAYLNLRTFVVNDNSVCSGAAYEEIKTNTVGYNLANVSIACFFMMWITLRAVRLEKGALLVCGVVIMATLIARSLYFAFEVADQSSVQEDLSVACKVAFPIASAIMLASVPLAWRVSQAFGWRHLTKFGADSDGVETMKGYKQLDACAKFDLYITVTAFVSLFFFVSDNFLRIYGFIVCAITVAFLVALNMIVKHRYYWALYAFYAICILMPVFYIYSLTKVLEDDGDTCTGPMLQCMSNARIGVYNNASMCVGTIPCYSFNTRCNTTMVPNDACYNASTADFNSCCNEYGRCQLKASFVENDKPLVLFLAVAGCVVRVLTVFVGYRQAQEMDVPNVQEMLRRGERNLKNFSLALPTFITRRGDGAAGGGNGTVINDGQSTEGAASPQPSAANFGT